MPRLPTPKFAFVYQKRPPPERVLVLSSSFLEFSAGIMEDNNRRSARNYQSLLGRLEDNGAEREILQVRLAHEIKEKRTMVRVGGRGIGFKEAEKKREKSKSWSRGEKFSYESYEPRKEKGKSVGGIVVPFQ